MKMTTVGSLPQLLTIALAFSTFTPSTTGQARDSSRKIPIEKDISEKVSSGVYSYDIRGPRPRIYESFAALTYEFKQPPLEIPKELRSVKCNGSKYTDGVYCPVLYYLHEMEEELKASASMLKTTFPEPLDSDSFYIPSCLEITKHFRSRTMSKSQLTKYQRALEACARNMTMSHSEIRARDQESEKLETDEEEESQSVESTTRRPPGRARMSGAIDVTRATRRLVTSSSPAPPSDPENKGKVIESSRSEFLFESVSTSLRNMSKDFLREYYSFLPGEQRVDAAILANQETAVYALGLGIFLTQASIWIDALNMCKKSLIPSQLLPWDEFQASLKTLERNLFPQGKALVIPTSNRTMSEYYANPLADCVATSEGLFLRVLVPVRKYESRWKAMSLTTIPFVYNDGADGDQLLCSVADAHNAKTYIHDLKTQAVFPQPASQCDQKNDLLCHVGEKSRSLDSYRKNCFTEIIRRTPYSQLKKICRLDCDSLDNYNLPVVLNVAPNVFYVAGKREVPVSGSSGSSNGTFTGLTIKCSESQIEQFNFPAEGVFELQPPCGCEILHNKQVIAVAVEPSCRQKMYITLVKPMHLTQASDGID